MTIGDTTKNKTLQFVGLVQETAGRVVGNPKLQMRGQTNQATANLRQAASQARNALKSAGRALKS